MMATEWLTALAMAIVVVAAVAGVFWALARADRKISAKARAELIAAPLGSFLVDAATMGAYARWQAASLDYERAQLIKRTGKIALWVTGLLLTAFALLGYLRTTVAEGAWIGLAFSGLIIGPVIVVSAGLALTQTLRARALRGALPQPTRMWVGTQGIAFEPGGFQYLQGAPFVANMLPGPPLVLNLCTRYSSSKGMRYVTARGPIPAECAEQAWASLAAVRQRWKLPNEPAP